MEPDRPVFALQRVQLLPNGMVELSAIGTAPVEVGGEPVVVFKKFAISIDNQRYPELRDALETLNEVVQDLVPMVEGVPLFEFGEDPDDEDAGMGD